MEHIATHESSLAQDRRLVERMLAGDERAFNEFFDCFVARLVAFALRRLGNATLAEDAAQETLIKAMQSLDAWRCESSLFTWLCGIAAHVIADCRRRESRRLHTVSFDHDAAVQERVLHLTVEPAGLLSRAADSADEAEIVRAVLSRLPEHYRRVLELKYGDELSVDEIARLLGVSMLAAQSMLARARAAFREEWSSTGQGGADSMATRSRD